MRVLIYSTAYSPFIGGAEVAVKEITDRLKDIDFHMITARMDRSLPPVQRVGNVTIHRIGLGIPFFDKFYLGILGHIRGIHLHQMQAFNMVWSIMASYSGFAARKFSKKTKTPFLLTLQEGDPIEYILHKVRFVRRQFNEIFTQAHGLQAISNYLLRWGMQMGFSGGPSKVIPNGVDIARFMKNEDEQRVREIRSSFGFPDNSTILVTASRLVTKNGIEHVVSALPLLPEQVCFVVCGSGELQSSLQELASKLGVSHRVNFLGNVSHDDLPLILKASDIFIRPSITEGLGNAFLEAMACGLPTIGTDAGGIPDFLHDNETGFVCEKENPDSIALTVKRILAISDQEREILVNRAKELVRSTYSWDTIQNDMRGLINNITI